MTFLSLMYIVHDVAATKILPNLHLMNVGHQQGVTNSYRTIALQGENAKYYEFTCILCTVQMNAEGINDCSLLFLFKIKSYFNNFLVIQYNKVT